MFSNQAAGRALRHCTNRFVTQRQPCKVTGLFPRWISVLRGAESRPTITAARPEKISFLVGGTAKQQVVFRRYLQQKSSKDSPQDTKLLLVGLGALGIVSAWAYKAGIFLPQNKGTTTKESDTNDNITLPTDSAESNEPVSDEANRNDNELTIEDEAKLTAVVTESEGNDEQTNKTEFIVAEVDEDTLIIEPAPSSPDLVSKDQDETVDAEVKSDDDAEKGKTSASENVSEGTTLNNTESNIQIDEKDTTVTNDPPKLEVKLPKIPESVPYLIIGAGTASHAACRAIRKNDPTARILIVGDEEVLPYMRPPLSKELWFSEDEDTADTLYFKQWNGKQRSVFFEDDTFYTKPQLLPTKQEGGTAVLTGHKVTEVNPAEHIVKLKNGATIKYQKLLIATGGHPKNHPIFENVEDTLRSKVTLFRTVADYRKLDKLVANSNSIAIIGGGFLGSELACALAAKSKKSGKKVTQIFHEDGNMGKVLPKYLSHWTTRKVEKEGVDVKSNAEVKNVSLIGDNVVMELSTGENVSADHVVVCIGIEPNTELAASAGLEVDPNFGGFRVNSELQARSDIWIAGDVSCFYDMKLGRRRVEHHDHAVVSGRLAGQNMTGEKNSYVHQSMFWSDLGPEVGYEAIGIVDNTLDTVGVWSKATKSDTPKAVVEATGESIRSASEQDAETGESTGPVSPIEIPYTTPNEEFGKGVVFYVRDNIVVGILLWNIFNKMPVARKILKDGKKQDDLKELAKLFNIHE